MSRASQWIGVVLIAALAWGTCASGARAGMPALLPTNWTADSPAGAATGHGFAANEAAANAHWQALSFFLACFFAAAWGLKGVWNSFRRESPRLPELGYGRSLALMVLWGLGFTVVLTMISGARELMTPGAWKKQGWTYKLADAGPPAESDGRTLRSQRLEALRFALWNHAATHGGEFPAADEPAIDPQLWEIPGGLGLRYLYRPGQSVATAGGLLAFEPDLNGDERQVLLTNGFLGSMRTSEIERLLDDRGTP